MIENYTIPAHYLSPVAIPPGETIREIIESRGMSQLELSRRLGKPHQAVNEIVNGKKAITKDTSILLERVLGLPVHFWVALEQNYQTCLAREKEKSELEEQISAFREFPYRELVKRGFLKDYKSQVDQIRESLIWLGMANFKALTNQINQMALQYRRNFKFDLPALKFAAWLRIGELAAEEVPSSVFEKKALKSSLSELRELTTRPVDTWIQQIRNIGIRCGVIFVFVPEFRSFPVVGVTRWFRNRPTIQMTLRGKRADIFWFTLFHEIGHVLLHDSKDVFIDIESPEYSNRWEAEADRFATDTLIPPNFYTDILDSGIVHGTQIENWAQELGIAPGILLGRLQHDNVIPQNRYHYLHQKFEWDN